MKRPTRTIYSYPRGLARIWWDGMGVCFDRKDGPAIERDDGSKGWYDKGKLVMYELADGSPRLGPSGHPLARRRR